jgi:hypothetical protein
VPQTAGTALHAMSPRFMAEEKKSLIVIVAG